MKSMALLLSLLANTAFHADRIVASYRARRTVRASTAVSENCRFERAKASWLSRREVEEEAIDRILRPRIWALRERESEGGASTAEPVRTPASTDLLEAFRKAISRSQDESSQDVMEGPAFLDVRFSYQGISMGTTVAISASTDVLYDEAVRLYHLHGQRLELVFQGEAIRPGVLLTETRLVAASQAAGLVSDPMDGGLSLLVVARDWQQRGAAKCSTVSGGWTTESGARAPAANSRENPSSAMRAAPVALTHERLEQLAADSGFRLEPLGHPEEGADLCLAGFAWPGMLDQQGISPVARPCESFGGETTSENTSPAEPVLTQSATPPPAQAADGMSMKLAAASAARLAAEAAERAAQAAQSAAEAARLAAEAAQAVLDPGLR